MCISMLVKLDCHPSYVDQFISKVTTPNSPFYGSDVV